MRTKRVLRAAVAFLFAFGVLAADLTPLRLPPQTASAVTQADIDKLKKESNALSSKKSEVNKQLSALKKDKANTLKRKALLDQQIDLISEEIANTEQQIAQYEALIEQTEQELSETQAQEADQYELFCKRVRAMEERGTVSYWSVLFQSSSFEELLGAMDFISEVMEADQRVIDDLRVLQAQIAEKQQTLETSLAEQQSAKEALAVKNNELRDQRTEATSLIKEMEENEADYKDVLAEIEAEEEKTQKEIVRLSKELAAQQGNTTVTYGGYIWPVTTSKRVSTSSEAWASTLSLPTRPSMTGRGALPLRKPWKRYLLAMSLYAFLMAASTSAACTTALPSMPPRPARSSFRRATVCAGSTSSSATAAATRPPTSTFPSAR